LTDRKILCLSILRNRSRARTRGDKLRFVSKR